MTKVSVIIPVYNVEKYLRQCLDSVVNQTLKDIEIICVDDGATDNSGIILDEYAAKDNRVKVIHKQNGGYGKAMNVGIEHATGEYIGIVEPDDYIELNMFEVLYNTALKTKVDFVKSDFYLFTEDLIQHERPLAPSKSYYGKVIHAKEGEELFNMDMNTWTGIYKTEYIKKNNIRYNETPGARYQDQGFWFQTLIFADSAYFINQPFYHYRFFKGNSTNNPNGFNWIQTEYNHIYDILKSHPNKGEKYSALYYKFKFCNYLFNYVKLDELSKETNFKVFRKNFENDYKIGKIDLSVFSNEERETFNLLMKHPRKFYKKMINSLSLIQKIFSITNQDNYKVIRILGAKLKINRKSKFIQTISTIGEKLRAPKIQKNKIVFNNFNGKGYGCNPKYIAQEIIRQKLPYKLVWLVNDPKKEKKNFPNEIKLIDYSVKNAIREFTRAKVWISNQRMPALYEHGLFKKKEQFYIQTWHGWTPIKQIEKDIEDKIPYWCKMAKIDSQYMDLLTCSSKFDKNRLSQCFYYGGEISDVGIPRDDIFYYSDEKKQLIKNKIYKRFNIPRENKILLYAPTFRDDGRIDSYDIDLEGCVKTLENKYNAKFSAMARLHPNLREKAKDVLKFNNYIDATDYPDVMELLLTSDVMITDYSCLMFEFMHTRKPVFLYGSDLDRYLKERNFYIDIKSLFFPFAGTNEELIKNIQNFDNVKYLNDVEKFIQESGSKDDGQASKYIVEKIKETIQNDK